MVSLIRSASAKPCCASPGVHHNRELFSAHTRHHTVISDNLLNLAGKRGQHAVATLMPIVIALMLLK